MLSSRLPRRLATAIAGLSLLATAGAASAGEAGPDASTRAAAAAGATDPVRVLVFSSNVVTSDRLVGQVVIPLSRLLPDHRTVSSLREEGWYELFPLPADRDSFQPAVKDVDKTGLARPEAPLGYVRLSLDLAPLSITRIGAAGIHFGLGASSCRVKFYDLELSVESGTCATLSSGLRWSRDVPAPIRHGGALGGPARCLLLLPVP